MTLIVANKAIVGQASLSTLAQLALTCVDGGLQWVNWAAVDASTSYEFADESALAAAVQQGLHGSRYALMPNLALMVSPVKLMTLGVADLRVLVQAELGGGNAATAVQTQSVLSRHGLVTQSGFDGVRSLLGTLGVAEAPIFQALGVEDLLSLYPLLDTETDADQPQDLRTEAAAFGVEQGRTPAEFVDYYQAYLGYLTRRGALTQTSAQRQQTANAALQTLLPLLFGAMNCPQVTGLVPPSEVAAAVKYWVQGGRALGFSRISEAASCMMRFSDYAGDPTQAQQTVRNYMSSLTAFLSSNPPRGGQMGQDGASCVFPIEAGGLRAELLLGPTGTISTRLFRRAPPATTTTTSSVVIDSPDNS